LDVVLKVYIEDGTGDWVKCDGLEMGVKVDDQYHFDEAPNFNIDSARTMTKAVQLSIKISGHNSRVSVPCSPKS